MRPRSARRAPLRTTGHCVTPPRCAVRAQAGPAATGAAPVTVRAPSTVPPATKAPASTTAPGPSTTPSPITIGAAASPCSRTGTSTSPISGSVSMTATCGPSTHRAPIVTPACATTRQSSSSRVPGPMRTEPPRTSTREPAPSTHPSPSDSRAPRATSIRTPRPIRTVPSRVTPGLRASSAARSTASGRCARSGARAAQAERLGEQLVGAAPRLVIVRDRHDDDLLGAVLACDLHELVADALPGAEDRPSLRRPPALPLLLGQEPLRLVDRRHPDELSPAQQREGHPRARREPLGLLLRVRRDRPCRDRELRRVDAVRRLEARPVQLRVRRAPRVDEVGERVRQPLLRSPDRALH